jgi:hypothetical protein
MLSIIAFGCAAAAFFGYGPMLAILGVLLAVLAMARGEGLAGPAVLVTLVIMVLMLVMPTSIAINRLG